MATNRSKMRLWAWLNLVLFLIMVGFNYAGAAGFINGMSQKAVSAMFATLITPAGFAFAIWGVIYLLQLVLMIRLIINHKQSNYAELITEISPLYWLSVAVNIAWTISFSYLNMLVAVVFIVLLLVFLKRICKKLLDNYKLAQFKLASTAFGLYAGWVSVATVVNIAAWTVQVKWNGFGMARATWAMIALVLALILVSLITYKIKNITYLLGVLWAFFAILMAHKSPQLFNDTYGGIQIVLIVGIVYILLLTGGVIYKKLRA